MSSAHCNITYVISRVSLSPCGALLLTAFSTLISIPHQISNSRYLLYHPIFVELCTYVTVRIFIFSIQKKTTMAKSTSADFLSLSPSDLSLSKKERSRGQERTIFLGRVSGDTNTKINEILSSL